MIKSEIYITESGLAFAREFWSLVRIYSHVKNEVVYQRFHPNGDLFYLLDDMQVNPDNTVLHFIHGHSLAAAALHRGFTIKESTFI